MSVDHDLLADYVGGALEGTPEQERVAGLIATSPEWSRAADELAVALHGVQLDLNILRETAEPMPQEVAARFDGLFDGPRRDPLEPRVVTPRAAGAPRTGRAGRGKAKAWKRWVGPVAVAAAALGVYGIGQVPSIMAEKDGSGNSAVVSEQAPAAAPPAPVPTAMTWRSYDRASLANAVAFSSGTDSGYRADVQKAEGARPPLQRLTDPAELRRCLDAVTVVVPGRVDFVEYAYFEGSPALVITITSPDGQTRFVAGGECGRPSPDEKFRTPLK